MKEIKLYKKNSKMLDGWEVKDYIKTVKLPKSLDIWKTPFYSDEKLYYVCCQEEDKCEICEIENYNSYNECEYNRDEITCPTCGYEECDSWEYESDSDETICEVCGTTFGWTRETRVTYSMEVKEVGHPIILT